MRAERLLRLVLLLQANGRMQAADLARRLEVSERTIQRDMDVLSGASIPVHARRGTNGGWMLVDGYRTSLTGLAPGEAAALVVGRSSEALAELGLVGSADAALLKVLAALPTAQREGAAAALQRIHIDDRGWNEGEGEDLPALPVLQLGLWRDCLVRIRYAQWSKPVTVAPLGLVAKRGVWYLVARRDDRILTYRVSRIEEVVATDEEFERPVGFDLAAHWREAVRRYVSTFDHGFVAELRVREEAAHRLHWASSTRIELLGAAQEGWQRATMAFENEAEARWFLLTMAGDVEVLAPPEMRAALADHARRMLELHR